MKPCRCSRHSWDESLTILRSCVSSFLPPRSAPPRYEPPPPRMCESCPSVCSILSARSLICAVMKLELESTGDAASVATQYLFQSVLRIALSIDDLKYEMSSW